MASSIPVPNNFAGGLRMQAIASVPAETHGKPSYRRMCFAEKLPSMLEPTRIAISRSCGEGQYIELHSDVLPWRAKTGI
jgi:hypothetical protein